MTAETPPPKRTTTDGRESACGCDGPGGDRPASSGPDDSGCDGGGFDHHGAGGGGSCAWPSDPGLPDHPGTGGRAEAVGAGESSGEVPPTPSARPDARSVRPPLGEAGFGPVRPAFRPVDILVRGRWRFGVVRAWCNGPDGWIAMIEYDDDAAPRVSSVEWFAYDPASMIRLTLELRPDAWLPKSLDGGPVSDGGLSLEGGPEPRPGP